MANKDGGPVFFGIFSLDHLIIVIIADQRISDFHSFVFETCKVSGVPIFIAVFYWFAFHFEPSIIVQGVWVILWELHVCHLNSLCVIGFFDVLHEIMCSHLDFLVGVVLQKVLDWGLGSSTFLFCLERQPFDYHVFSFAADFASHCHFQRQDVLACYLKGEGLFTIGNFLVIDCLNIIVFKE